MKNLNSKNLIVIGAIAIMFVQSSVALAYVPGVWDPQQGSVSNNQSAFTALPIIDEPVNIVRTVNKINPNATTTKTVATNTSTVKSTDTKATDATAVDENGNNLAALSVAGSGGFMPSSIFQWILVVLLILAIVIIARKLAKKNQAHEEELHMAHAH